MKINRLYLPKFLKSKAFILSIFIIIYLSLFVLVYVIHINHPSFTRYILSDWLINYANGFVRRGFAGEILFFFTKQRILLNPSEFILFSTSLFFLFFSLIYLVKIKRNFSYIDNFNLLTVLFLPSLLLFPLIDGALGRKEVIFLILLLFNLNIVKNKIDLLKKNRFEDQNQLKILKNSYFNQIFIWFNLISIPLTLTHESIIFLSLPINMVITNSFLAFKTSGKKVILRTFQAYLPTLLVVLLCFMAKGGYESAVKICESWQSLGILDCSHKLPGALRHFGMSLKFFIMIQRQQLYSHYQYLAYIIMFMLNLLFLLNSSSIILSNYLKSISHDSISYLDDYFTSFSFKYLVIPLFCSLPLYLLGVDWGRWFFIFSVSYVFCVLTPNLILLEIDKEDPNLIWQPKIINNFYKKYISLTKNILYVCQKNYVVYKIIATYIFFFTYISHSGMTFINFHQSLFYKLFDYISRL